MGWAITTESQLQHHDIPETPPNILQRDQLFAITFSAHPYSRPLLLEAQREHRVGTLAMDHNTALTTARVAQPLTIISTRLCAHKQRPSCFVTPGWRLCLPDERLATCCSQASTSRLGRLRPDPRPCTRVVCVVEQRGPTLGSALHRDDAGGPW